MSMNYKKTNCGNKHFDQEERIMGSHIPYNCASTKLLHILINQWYHRLWRNCKGLKNPHSTGRLKERKRFYEVESIGKNIKFTNKGKYIYLLFENTKQNWIMILVRFKEVMSNPKLCFSRRVVTWLRKKNCVWK